MRWFAWSFTLLIVGLFLLPTTDDTQLLEPVVQPAPAVTHPFPGHLSYQGVLSRLEAWERESHGWAETGEYGKSTRGKVLKYLRVRPPSVGEPVLVTGCIHGNEPLSTGVVMAWLGTMLSTYETDAEAKEVMDTRDIYFIPVVSPDSYPSGRHVDGVDPNRDFPGPHSPQHRSVPPVAAVQELFKAKGFKAAISAHTFGRVFLTPYGDTMELCQDQQAYQGLMRRMVNLCDGYRTIRACQMYGRPIQGSEVDWYYRNGAMSIVWELGTHQNIPSMRDIEEEWKRTYRAFLLFVKEAPTIRLKTRGFRLTNHEDNGTIH